MGLLAHARTCLDVTWNWAMQSFRCACIHTYLGIHECTSGFVFFFCVCACTRSLRLGTTLGVGRSQVDLTSFVSPLFRDFLGSARGSFTVLASSDKGELGTCR